MTSPPSGHDTNTRHPFSGTESEPRFGRTAIMYVASRCNLDCVFCLEKGSGWTPRPTPEAADIQREMTALYERGARHITFMGAETFFRKDLHTLLAFARELGYSQIGVTTNGTVLSKPGFYARLREAGLAFIEFSIHAADADLARDVSGNPATFERQMRALTELEKLTGTWVIFNIVIHPLNVTALAEIPRLITGRFPAIQGHYKLKWASRQRAEKNEVGTPFTYDLLDAVALGRELDEMGVDFSFDNFPLCRLGPYAHRSHKALNLLGDVQYFDYKNDQSGEYFDSGRQFDGYVFPEQTCAGCSLEPLCSGVRDPYHGRFGSSALTRQTRSAAELAAEVAQTFGLGDSVDPIRQLEHLAAEARPRPSEKPGPQPDAPARPVPPPARVVFAHPEVPEPVELDVAPRDSVPEVFAASERLALTYRGWPAGDPWSNPIAQPLLAGIRDRFTEATSPDLTLEEVVARLREVRVDRWEPVP